MKRRVLVIGVVAASALLGISIFVGSMFAPDPSCVHPARSESIEKKALDLIPADKVLAAETMDDCDSGGPVYQQVTFTAAADASSVLDRLDGRSSRHAIGQFAAVEKMVDGTWVRFSFERRAGQLEVSIELA